MLDLACLRDGHAAGPSAADTFGWIVGIVFLALAAAAIASPLVRARYRARVTRLMALEQVLPRPPAWWQHALRRSEGATVAATAAGPRTAAELHARAAQVERRIRRATLVARPAYALVAAAIAGILGQSQAPGMRLADATVVALFAVGPVLANLPRRWSRRALALGSVALAAGAALGTAIDPGTSDSASDIALGAAVLAVIYVALLHRSLRGQVLPVFVVAAVAMLALAVPALLLDARIEACIDVAKAATTRSLFIVVMTLPALWIGFRALAGLLRLGERGWFSDVSLPSFVALGVGALAWVAGAPAVESEHVTATVAALPLVWLALTALAYAVALGRHPTFAAAPQLLMLRVFAQRSRQHAMLDAIQQRWRCVGPVHQIGGPDLAALNVDLDECAMYLTGRLHELFLPEAASAERLQSLLRTRPDREGRFAINEVFCFNTAWRAAVEQLMRLSDAVVLDLRGFTGHRRGTAFEIGLLGHAALLARVVAIGDVYTNWRDVEALLRDVGADPAQLARFDEREGSDALFDRLLAVAAR